LEKASKSVERSKGFQLDLKNTINFKICLVGTSPRGCTDILLFLLHDRPKAYSTTNGSALGEGMDRIKRMIIPIQNEPLFRFKVVLRQIWGKHIILLQFQLAKDLFSCLRTRTIFEHSPASLINHPPPLLPINCNEW
jgi:hypothetical protein